eukprot:TRINITY_DN250_c1_g2_i2.p1 TRINITY_DN250_c1_g2~~TRINITY_DN250_c1_g2_i2.p1  ORF type:complete len:379 (-),score=52.38 TRINITY_DN250_c1_g2_i2:107-1243(-)
MTSHVVIVGGGLQGCHIAYYLKTRHGISSTIVEQTCVAAGASGKGGGFLARDWGSGPTRSLHHAGFDAHAELQETLSLSSYRILSTVQASPSSRVRRTDDVDQLGLAKAWLNGKVSVTSMGDNTAQVHPRELCEAVFAASGATLIQARAVGVIESGGVIRSIAVVDSSGTSSSVECSGSVVFTLGPWSGLVEKWLPGHVRVPMEGIQSSSMVIRPTDQANELLQADPCAVFCGEDENGCHLELYPRNDGTVYVCGLGGSPHRSATDLIQPSSSFRTADAVLCNQDRVDAALKSFRTYAPDILKDAEVVERQACLRPYIGGLPMMGKIHPAKLKNAFISCGHNCWGILWAPAQGIAMADLIATGKCPSAIPLDAFTPKR